MTIPAEHRNRPFEPARQGSAGRGMEASESVLGRARERSRLEEHQHTKDIRF
jgi:hypothetical protein